ncbi:PRC-barrel domain-containing protein [Streptomyces sp. NPDC059076]|uniref:PRC-barrel domain-containing protein n=1 Tax=unclassified Streptomyces TaxID=2593676 RepID=UPI0036796979
MFLKPQVAGVFNHPVLDTDGRKLGHAKRVFFDETSGEPEWISVKTGLFDTHETFVPVRGASVLGDHVEVPYTKDQVKDAPQVDVDAKGHLSEREEHRLYDHYGIDWDAAWKWTGLTGDAGAAASAQGNGAMADFAANAMTRARAPPCWRRAPRNRAGPPTEIRGDRGGRADHSGSP